VKKVEAVERLLAFLSMLVKISHVVTFSPFQTQWRQSIAQMMPGRTLIKIIVQKLVVAVRPTDFSVGVQTRIVCCIAPFQTLDNLGNATAGAM